MSQPLIISASGIRGVVGRGLTPEVTARYGAAFGTYLRGSGPGRPGAVLVGRDSRTSGELLLDAVSAGLRASGTAVLDMGVVPTPTGLLAVEHADDAIGGVLVTASHNPVEWNGLKLAGPDGRFLSAEAGTEIQRLYEAGPAHAAWDELGLREPFVGAVAHHLSRILALPILEADEIRARSFRVALDCVHGAGGEIMTALLERLGCEVVGIGLEPDGRFPRAPEPVPENLGELAALVREAGAAIGLAVDPDVDRLALIDETGAPAGEDWTLALAVELVQASEPGPVVTNLSSSRSIEDAAERAGAPFHRAPVGEANVVAEMLRLGAVIGGEGNGGVIYPALHLTRDAPLAAALILQFLARSRAPLSEIISARPGYRIVKHKVERRGLAVGPLLDGLRSAAPAGVTQDTRDGLRLEWPDGRWVHVRPSGTEPILRIVAEAQQAGDANELARWVEERVRAAR